MSSQTFGIADLMKNFNSIPSRKQDPDNNNNNKPFKINLSLRKSPNERKFENSIQEIQRMKSFEGLEDKIKNPPKELKQVIEFIQNAQPDITEALEIDMNLIHAFYRYIWKIYIETKDPKSQYLQTLKEYFNLAKNEIQKFSLPSLMKGKIPNTTCSYFMDGLAEEYQKNSLTPRKFTDEKKFKTATLHPEQKKKMNDTKGKTEKLTFSCSITGEQIDLMKEPIIYTYRCDTDATNYDTFFFKNQRVCDVAVALKFINYLPQYIKVWVLDLEVPYSEVDDFIFKKGDPDCTGELIDIVYYFSNFIHKIQKSVDDL